MNKIIIEGKIKLYGVSLVKKLTAFVLIAGLILGNISLSIASSTAKISVTAVVLPKAPPINYKRLHENIMKRIEDYSPKGRMENQGKYLKATVNLDFPEGSPGIVIEEVEYTP